MVLGCTLIVGGHGTALGTWFAAIFPIPMLTIMQIPSLPRGTRDPVPGAVVILVPALAARDPARAGVPRPRAPA